jgi:hypothetical protein
MCLDDDMPTVRKCNQWLREHSEFKLLFEQSLQDRLSIFEEDIVRIADDSRNDFKTVSKRGQEKRIPDADMVSRSKLRIEVRRLHLIAGRPNKWGSSTTLITKSDDGFDTSNMSAEQPEAEIAAMRKRAESPEWPK